MTDILVAAPRGVNLSHKMDFSLAWWNTGRPPKKIQQNDTIYFIEDGEIRYKATYMKTEREAERHYRLYFFDMKRLKEPYEKYPGFQGFRYLY